ncbi:MAG: radical SAM protein [Thermofilum sp.]
MKCRVCGFESEEISRSVGVCVECLRREETSILHARRARERWRRELDLPLPSASGGRTCALCSNECEIEEGRAGFCGVVKNEGGRLTTITGSFEKALIHWYYDPHPTNCVAFPVCPERDRIGYRNLAVFFSGCNLDCLFCQNVDHKYMIAGSRIVEGDVVGCEELVQLAMDQRTTCVCYFGGDPTPWSVYALRVSREIAKRAQKRICWETNGLENPKVMERMARLSLESGGIVKIDWKAYTPSVYEALTGADGKKAVSRLKENVSLLVRADTRKTPPLLVVSVLVVPHYVDEVEVGGIAEYLAGLDPEIPLVLLAFAPQHLMHDVPTTSKKQMEAVRRRALEAGLKNVFVGNVWLLR